MTIPILDLTRQYAAIGPELEAAALRVLRSGRYILGPEVEQLEAELAAQIGVADCVACSSGTDALLAPLMALGVGPGDAVIVPVYSFFATAGVVTRLGARPLFVDVDPNDHCIDPAGVARALAREPRVRAMIPVHLFGAPAPIGALRELAAARDVPIVEDAAQAIGTRAGGAQAGALGKCGAFSTFPTKNLGGCGDGGFITTREPEFGKLLRQLRNHGQSDAYRHERVGGNFRMDALQAALLRVKLRHLTAWNEARRRNAARYRELFAAAGLLDRVRLPGDAGGAHTFHQYVLHLPAASRDLVRARLTEQGIGCAVYYPLPFHLQPCWRGLGHREGEFPVAEAAARSNLALPIYPELRPDEQERVVAAIAQALAA
jgi:dTDP-4-amino-4,6-dideoxygalactose transaminase